MSEKAMSGITSVADFKGKRIAVGPDGSGGEVDARETLAAYGLTYKDMKVSFVEYTPGVEMLQDDEVDGAILGLALGASGMTELILDNKTNILPITDAALANLKQFTKDLVLSDDQMLIPYLPAARKYFVEQGWLKP